MAAVKTRGRLNCILVSHLRAEKVPLRALAALENLLAQEPVFLLPVGEALFTARQCGTRFCVSGAALRLSPLAVMPLLVTGAFESAHGCGADGMVEAVTAGTLLPGAGFQGTSACSTPTTRGCCPVGNASALAELLGQCRAEPAFYNRLVSQCLTRSTLIRPARERVSRLAVIREPV